MSSFNAAGRAWTLFVDIPTRKAVKDATDGKVDLFAAFGEELYVQLADPGMLVNVLWTMVGGQADGKVTPEQFGAAFRGDLIEQASNALQEAIADFFPTRQKALLTKAVTKGNEQMATIFTEIDRQLDNPGPAATSSASSTSLPESQASTPAG